MNTKSCKKYLPLILGILSFIIYLVIRSQSGQGQRPLRASVKLITNACLICFAIIGINKNRSLRNAKLIEALIFYAVGDISTLFSIPVGGIFYLIGHLVIIRSLYITTLIQRKNIVCFVILTVFSTLLMLWLFRDDLGSAPVYMIYGLILSAKLALAISNPIYLIASIIFTLSDVLGAYRITINGVYSFGFHIVTISTYYAGIILYAFSAYRYETKPVVTWSNMTVLARNLTKSGIRFCFTQAFGRDIAAGRYLSMHSDAYIAVDTSDRANIEKILTRMEYRLTDSFDECDMYVYYSELFGFLNISFRTFTHGSVMLDNREYTIKNRRSVFLKTGIPAISEDL